MNRFYFPDIFFNVRNSGNLLAFFSFVDNETGLEYSNWRLVQGANGVFVSSPFQTYQPEGATEPKYYNFVKPAYDKNAESKRNAKGSEFFDALCDAAKAYYDRKTDGAVSGGPPASTGRGPVEDSGDDDLPF